MSGERVSRIGDRAGRIRGFAIACLVGCLSLTVAFAQAPVKKKSTPPAKKPAATKAVAVSKPAAPKPTPPAPKPAPRPSPAWSVAFSPDGKRLLVGGYKKVTVYDTESGAKIAEWPVGADAARSLAFSPDGSRVAIGTGVPAQTGGAVIVDANTGAVVRTLTSHEDSVEAVAFESSQLLLTASDDEEVGITDLATGNRVGALKEHNGRCLSVAVPTKTDEREGGNIFATGGADNMLKVWDAQARRVVVNFDQCGSPVWAVIARPVAGRFVAGSGDGFIRFFGVRTDPDGKAETNGGIRPRTGFLERQFPAHEGGVYALACSPNDALLVSGGADGKVTLWNMGGGKRKDFLDAHADIWGVAFSSDGKRFASASLDGKARIYDAEKNTLLLELPVTPKPVDDTLSTDPKVAGTTAAKPGTMLFAPKPGTGTGLLGQYYSGQEVGGKPLLTRVDPAIDFEWSANGPSPEVSNENFSARWTGWIEAPITGNYRIHTFTDDGVRLYLNGRLAIDNWTDHGTTEDTTDKVIPLQAGQVVAVRLEYYQGYGGAEMRLRWSYEGVDHQPIPANRMYAKLEPRAVAPPAPSVSRPKLLPGLQASYFANPDLSGAPTLVRRDSMIDFVWGQPAPNVGPQNFSARWEGYVEAPVAGEYQFYAIADDGVRLWVANQPLIDDWSDHAPTEIAAKTAVRLKEGERVPIRLDYVNRGASGKIALLWSYPGQAKQAIPEYRFFAPKAP